MNKNMPWAARTVAAGVCALVLVACQQQLPGPAGSAANIDDSAKPRAEQAARAKPARIIPNYPGSRAPRLRNTVLIWT